MYKDLIGKEFSYGARGPDKYDCYGLCMEVLRRHGVALPNFGSAVQSHIIHEMILSGKEFFTELPGPEPFCLVTFWIRPKFTTHIGIVLEDSNRFLHILKKERAVIERLDSVLWKHRITGYYALVT
ncbi:MAG: C40 family peptidase [Nitrospirae bacterium]|nr:C40 family peptidase [Nitrospirota bacterium]